MKIGTYQLTSLEQNRILVIYEKLKHSFPCIRIDCRGNSFEHINAENCEFSKSVLAEINEHGHVAYQQYKEIFTQSSSPVKNLIALIKKHNLHFSFPFLIEK